MIYWWRCVQPSLVSSIAREFDSVVEQALHNVMSLNLPDPSGLEGQCLRLQESLPLKMGGIGLRKSAALCSLAFVPSFLTACQHSSFPPSLKSLIMLSIGNDSNTAPEGSGVITDFTNVWPSVRDLVKKVGPLLPTTKFPDFSDPLAILAAVRHKGALSQSSLSRLMDLKVSNDLLALLPDPEKARVMSCAGPYASSWLSVIPTAQSLRIIDANFRVAIAYRFGLHLPTAPLWGPTCCHTEAAPLDPQGRHFSSCYAATGLRSSRHNDLVKYWRRAMSCAGVVSVLEVAGVFGDTGQRPDIFVFRWPDPEGLSRAFDAVISDPSCPSHCKAAAVRPLATADKAEKLKVAKYGHLAKRYSFDFVPLSFETYGAWGKSAVKTLDDLAKLAHANCGINAAVYKRVHGRALSVALVLTQAQMLREISVKQMYTDSDGRGGAVHLRHDAHWYEALEAIAPALGAVHWASRASTSIAVSGDSQSDSVAASSRAVNRLASLACRPAT